MPRQTSVQLTEATEQQIAALRAQGYGTTTNIIRTAIDRMAREETMKPVTIGTHTLYMVSDRYGDHQYATTLEAFKADCKETFGKAPRLMHSNDGRNDYYRDEHNEVVLTNDPAITGYNK